MKNTKYRFNTTGLCRPELHYMVNPLRGLKDPIYRIIEGEEYFAIHAPRQTGKTTLLHALAKQLNKERKYISVVFSVESAGYESITEHDANIKIIDSLYGSCTQFLEKKYFPKEVNKFKQNLTLQNYLSDWSRSQKKPIVLLIDEIDSLYDDVLVSILRQLRNGFQGRPDSFPSSIALVGLRDVREYKMKVRSGSRSLGSGSPFNIKAESILIERFSRNDINDLYSQYTKETGQVFTDAIINRIYELTGGQPWLTNSIANEIVVKILKNDYSKKITNDIVEQAKENLILRRDTHLDSLMDKLKEDRIKRIVSAIINGEDVLFDNYSDDLLYTMDLGIVRKTEDKKITFSNKIYAEIIPRVLNHQLQDNIENKTEQSWYLKEDGTLDMDKLLKAFQEFYRENSEHWIDMFYYKEAGQQLLLMAFLQRVINGGGRIDREMAIGRGRTDLLIEFKKEKFVLELKLKHRPDAKQKGLDQISQYLDTLGLSKGYLIIFELKSSSKISWRKRIKWSKKKHQDKEIIVIEM